MERERTYSVAEWIGVIALIMLIPAVLYFIARDQVSSTNEPAAESFLSSAEVADVKDDGIVDYGSGRCTVSEDEIVINGAGMTTCRIGEWATMPYLDQQVSTGVVGIREGATVVFRFRESEGRRLEVAVGRFAVAIREKRGDEWVTVTSIPRQTPTTSALSAVEVSPPASQQLRVGIAGNLVTVEIDGVEVASGVTTIDDQGLFSIGAVTNDEVAVRFSSITVTDAG